MTPLEAAALCRFTKAVCPQQAIDEFTPDAWHPLLKDLRFEDARDAVVSAAQKSPFVAPAEIRAEVRRLRNGRIDAFGPLPVPPPELADDPEGEMGWRAAIIRRVADGDPVERPQVLEEASVDHTAKHAEILALSRLPEMPDATKETP